MPELPEVEITARLLERAVSGTRVSSALAPGVNALKTFNPPLHELADRQIKTIRRRGKLFLLEFEGDLTVVIHLMSAGRLQLYDRPASVRDRTSRVLLRLDDGRELRLREFGTKQRAWAKLLPSGQVAQEETIASLGPDAWPAPPPFDQLIDAPRPLYGLLRDQHVIAGIGRSWVDEILHGAAQSPFKRGSELDSEEAALLRAETVARLGGAIEQYEATLRLPVPDKLPMPLAVHAHRGEPCPRCGEEIEAVFFEDYVMCYCPACQTGGRLMKDRRLSRLLK